MLWVLATEGEEEVGHQEQDVVGSPGAAPPAGPPSPSKIRAGWLPQTHLPFCKAIIFWCCCSVKAVNAFKCFKVNSKTTAFSRCPSVCSGVTKGAGVT